jgi:uncharacterized membrane protein
VSRINLGILLAAISLIILGVFLDIAIFRNGSGVIFVVGLVYAYVVAKREAALMSHALDQRAAEQESKQSGPPAQPTGMSEPRTHLV